MATSAEILEERYGDLDPSMLEHMDLDSMEYDELESLDAKNDKDIIKTQSECIILEEQLLGTALLLHQLRAWEKKRMILKATIRKKRTEKA